VSTDEKQRGSGIAAPPKQILDSMLNTAFPLVVADQFIQATRDSGYKSLGSALAELVDNAFEAKASNVIITLEKRKIDDAQDVLVRVADDGLGMNVETLRHALQFGWSSRFNQRDSHGRYGMGLPNASLSHARRAEILSSCDGMAASGTYLDVDEIVSGHTEGIPEPYAVSWTEFTRTSLFQRGTAVTWRKCDRLLERKLGPLTRRLRVELGRLFRYQIWAKKSIVVNGEVVVPFDPTFTREGANLVGASPFGPVLTFEVTISNGNGQVKSSIINVRFVELPVSEWHGLSNVEKNSQGIAKNAGVSIVRAGREIDCGWFFMGQKRKENYDDWWRCEVCFDPDLDELFGVTHTKQEIHPTEQLLSILVPDLERTARELNARARRAFTEVKDAALRRRSESLAERFDNLMEPPGENDRKTKRAPRQRFKGGRGQIAGLEYRLRFNAFEGEDLFEASLDGTRLAVTLNENHPFVRRVWPTDGDRGEQGGEMQYTVELLLLALARCEFALARMPEDRQRIEVFRHAWSNTLATFLT